jgi:uncharacterized protein (TIGR02001 family)
LRSTCLLAALIAASLSARADVHGELTLASDYVLRGISQSARRAVVQTDLRVDTASGLYGGVFASPVRFASPRDNGIEADLYAGLSHSVSPDLAWDFGVRRYTYSGLANYVHADYSEFHGSVSYRALAFTATYSPRYYDDASHSLYLQVDYLRELRAGLNLGVHLGQRRELDTANATDGPYTDIEIQLTQHWRTWTARIAWAGATRHQNACLYQRNDCKGALRLELGWRY